MKLYTEEQVREAIQMADKYHHLDTSVENGIMSLLTPIELPSDDEILNESDEFELNSRVSLGMHQSFEIGAKWIKDKILNK